MDHEVRTERTVMELIRYNTIEKVVDVPLYHPFYQGFRLGGYQTNFSMLPNMQLFTSLP